ncbi:MAG: hypothetical protein WKH64_15925 [Chloroflexia bacterium]
MFHGCFTIMEIRIQGGLDLREHGWRVLSTERPERRSLMAVDGVLAVADAPEHGDVPISSGRPSGSSRRRKPLDQQLPGHLAGSRGEVDNRPVLGQQQSRSVRRD